LPHKVEKPQGTWSGAVQLARPEAAGNAR